jgi:glycerol kinase
MSKARIFRPAKNAMQSGRAKTRQWLLVWEPQEPMPIDPLMGWNGMNDTTREICLRFPTKEAAVEYAKKQGLDYEFSDPHERKPKIRPYADNFSFNRIRA